MSQSDGEKVQASPTRPQYRPEPDQGQLPFGGKTTTAIPVHTAADLLQRLIQHGCDAYAGEFATLADRIRHTIVAYHLTATVQGRWDDRPETYAQCFERVCHQAWEPKRKAGGA